LVSAISTVRGFVCLQCGFSVSLQAPDPPTEFRPKWTNRQISNLKFSMGLFVLYFGTTRQYPDIATTPSSSAIVTPNCSAKKCSKA
jgi:hypothetical protein